MAKLFIAEFTHLLESFEVQDARNTFSTLLETASVLDKASDYSLTQSLADSVFSRGGPALKAAFFSALIDALDKDAEDLRTSSLQALLRISPSSLAREQREEALRCTISL